MFFATFAIEIFAGIAKLPRMDDPQRALKLWLAEKLSVRGMATKLSKATGMSPDKITRSKETGDGEKREIALHEIRQLADFFGETPPGFEWVSGSQPEQPKETIVAGARVALTEHPTRGGLRDLPVPGIAMGGSEQDGDVRLNGEIQMYLDRPAGLIGRKKAFAVILRNDSMVRSFYPGNPIFVDEDGRRPQVGDDVLIELYPDEDGATGPAFVKILVARGAKEVVVRQLNPEKEIRFPADRVKQILRVIPYPEAMGLSL